MQIYRAHALVCRGTGCSSHKAEEIFNELERQLQDKKLTNEVKVTAGCLGLCKSGPNLVIYPEGAIYSGLQVEDVEEIVTEHLLKGRIVKRLLFGDTEADAGIKSLDDVGFFKRQKRIALRNCGVINPESIDEYSAFDGYKALTKVLTEMEPAEVIDVLKNHSCAGVVVQVFPPAPNGNLLPKLNPSRNMFAVTLMKATRAPLWTEVFLRGIRIH